MEQNNTYENHAVIIIKAILYFAILAFGSYILGAALILPSARFINKYTPHIFNAVVGGVVLFLVFQAIRAIRITAYNLENSMTVANSLPETFRGASDLGIKTRVDFCVAMISLFTYKVLPIYAVDFYYEQSVADEPWQKAVRLFELMFGEKPEGYMIDEEKNETVRSWPQLAMFEARKELGIEDASGITMSQMYKLLSPELIERWNISVEGQELRFGGTQD